MSPLIFGVSISILFLGFAVLLRNLGARPGRVRSVLSAFCLCVALVALAATLIAPFALSVPKSLTTIAERVLPHAPKSPQIPFHYKPTVSEPASHESH